MNILVICKDVIMPFLGSGPSERAPGEELLYFWFSARVKPAGSVYGDCAWIGYSPVNRSAHFWLSSFLFGRYSVCWFSEFIQQQHRLKKEKKVLVDRIHLTIPPIQHQHYWVTNYTCRRFRPSSWVCIVSWIVTSKNKRKFKPKVEMACAVLLTTLSRLQYFH